MKGFLWFLAVIAAIVGVHFFAGAVFGLGALELVLELMLVGLFALLFAVFPFWPLASIARRLVVRRLWPAASPYLRLRWCLVWAFALLLVPHLWMSHELAPLKREFARVCERGPHSIKWGAGYHEADFRGKLDRLVDARIKVLARYQFVPYLTGNWSYREGWSASNVSCAYIYTFLPGPVYRLAFTGWGG